MKTKYELESSDLEVKSSYRTFYVLQHKETENYFSRVYIYEHSLLFDKFKNGNYGILYYKDLCYTLNTMSPYSNTFFKNIKELEAHIKKMYVSIDSTAPRSKKRYVSQDEALFIIKDYIFNNFKLVKYRIDIDSLYINFRIDGIKSNYQRHVEDVKTYTKLSEQSLAFHANIFK